MSDKSKIEWTESTWNPVLGCDKISAGCKNCYAIRTNVWLGVSCEDQKTADERIPLLLQTPAAVRWISAEPLLGHIDLIGVPVHNAPPNSPPDYCSSALWGDPRMNWVVVGGESGPGARPMHPDWARSLRDECVAAKVPFFFKQWGEYIFDATPDQSKSPSPDIVHKGTFRRVGKKASGRLLDGKEWNQYPEAK